MNAEVTLPADNARQPSGWDAYLRLDLRATHRGVRLTNKAHRGPLYVQKPFYPEGLQRPHVYLLHPPGGLVSGDHLNIEVNAGTGAHVLLTTPGAGRLYRARPDRARQQQTVTLNVAEQGSLEWLPMESILFPDANAHSTVNIRLQSSARMIYWDVLSIGLPATQQRFDRGQFSQCLRIFQAETLVLQERLHLDDTSRALLTAAIGCQNFMVQGLLVAGPFTGSQADLVSELRASVARSQAPIGITEVAGFVVIRGLENCSETLRTTFQELWAQLRPALLGCPACPPRIWNT